MAEPAFEPCDVISNMWCQIHVFLLFFSSWFMLIYNDLSKTCVVSWPHWSQRGSATGSLCMHATYATIASSFCHVLIILQIYFRYLKVLSSTCGMDCRLNNVMAWRITYLMWLFMQGLNSVLTMASPSSFFSSNKSYSCILAINFWHSTSSQAMRLSFDKRGCMLISSTLYWCR